MSIQPLTQLSTQPLVQTTEEPKNKILLSEIDFDSINIEDLRCIYNEIEQILLADTLFTERKNQLKEKISKEKERLLKKMLKELQIERKKMEEEYESDEESDSNEEVEIVTYNKKTPKGQVKKIPAKKQVSKKK